MNKDDSNVTAREGENRKPLSMLVDIHGYEDYRRFIIDRFGELQSIDPLFSQRRLSRIAGFANPGFFNEVIKGRRRLSPAATMKMILGLKLSPGDAEYFALLVEYVDGKDPETKRTVGQRMQSHRNRKIDRPVEAKRVELHSQPTDGLKQEGHLITAEFSISDGTYRRILDKMADFRGQVLEMVESDGQPAMRDVHLSLQMLPRSPVSKSQH